MERSIQMDERIRRAEEIYYSRREPNNMDRQTTRVNVNDENEKNFKLFKKMLLQIVLCTLIYFVFTLVQNSNYIFSEEFNKKANEILSYDINISGAYDGFKSYIFKQDNVNNAEENDDASGQTDTNEPITIEDDTLGQGGGEYVSATSAVFEVTETHEEASSYNQMQIDADEIKSRVSFILPVSGTISSRFGVRETDNPIVSKYHSGIDIAANTGTKIMAAMEGTVLVAGFESSLGNYIIIQNENIQTLYAHCSKLYVKNGAYVKQEAEIGEVGSTGNSTGPHLHFQIEISGRVVNPEYVLNF